MSFQSAQPDWERGCKVWLIAQGFDEQVLSFRSCSLAHTGCDQYVLRRVTKASMISLGTAYIYMSIAKATSNHALHCLHLDVL